MKPNNFKSRLLVAVLFFAAIAGAIFLGFILLKKYSSKTFVLSKSIENVTLQSKNSMQTKILLNENTDLVLALNTHALTRQDQVPAVIDTLEAYADSLGLPIKINNINFIEPTKTSVKKLTIDVSSNGDFTKVLKLMKLFENADYPISIERYSLKQSYISQSTGSGGPSFIDVPATEFSANGPAMIKTWLLTVKLSIPTYIK